MDRSDSVDEALEYAIERVFGELFVACWLSNKVQRTADNG